MADEQKEKNEQQQEKQEDKQEFTVDGLKKDLKKTREEAAKYRTERNEVNEKLEGLNNFKSKVESLFGEDSEDPEKQISSLQAENQRLKNKSNIQQAALDNGGDIELLTAIFKDKDFETYEELEDAVKKRIESNPKFRSQVVKNIGTNHTNGDSEQKQKRTMNDIIRAKAGK